MRIPRKKDRPMSAEERRRIFQAFGDNNLTYDGDTVFKVNDDGYKQDSETVRIQGINAPEMDTGRLGTLSRDVMNMYLQEEGVEEIDSGERGYYGRRLGSYVDKDGEDIAKKLVAHGLAAPYNAAVDPEMYIATQQARARELGIGAQYDTEQGRLIEALRREAAEGITFDVDKMREGIVDVRGQRHSTVTNAFARGIDQMQMMGYGAIKAVGDAVGSDVIADFAQRGVEFNTIEILGNPSKVAEWDDVDSLSKFGTYFIERLGEELPSLLTDLGLAIGTGGGSVLASTAGKAAIGKAVKRKVGDKVYQRFMKKHYGEEFGNRSRALAKTRATTAAATSMYTQLVGENKLELDAAGVEGASLTPFLTAIPQTATEFFALSNLLKGAARAFKMPEGKLGSFTGEALKRVGAVGGSMATESGTEALQTIMSKVAVSYHNGEDVFSEENLKDIREAAIVGGLVGGSIRGTSETLGGITQGVRHLRGDTGRPESPPTTFKDGPQPVETFEPIQGDDGEGIFEDAGVPNESMQPSSTVDGAESIDTVGASEQESQAAGQGDIFSSREDTVTAKNAAPVEEATAPSQGDLFGSDAQAPAQGDLFGGNTPTAPSKTPVEHTQGDTPDSETPATQAQGDLFGDKEPVIPVQGDLFGDREFAALVQELGTPVQEGEDEDNTVVGSDGVTPEASAPILEESEDGKGLVLSKSFIDEHSYQSPARKESGKEPGKESGKKSKKARVYAAVDAQGHIMEVAQVPKGYDAKVHSEVQSEVKAHVPDGGRLIAISPKQLGAIYSQIRADVVAKNRPENNDKDELKAEQDRKRYEPIINDAMFIKRDDPNYEMTYGEAKEKALQAYYHKLAQKGLNPDEVSIDAMGRTTENMIRANARADRKHLLLDEKVLLPQEQEIEYLSNMLASDFKSQDYINAVLHGKKEAASVDTESLELETGAVEQGYDAESKEEQTKELSEVDMSYKAFAGLDEMIAENNDWDLYDSANMSDDPAITKEMKEISGTGFTPGGFETEFFEKDRRQLASRATRLILIAATRKASKSPDSNRNLALEIDNGGRGKTIHLDAPTIRILGRGLNFNERGSERARMDTLAEDFSSGFAAIVDELADMGIAAQLDNSTETQQRFNDLVIVTIAGVDITLSAQAKNSQRRSEILDELDSMEQWRDKAYEQRGEMLDEMAESRRTGVYNGHKKIKQVGSGGEELPYNYYVELDVLESLGAEVNKFLQTDLSNEKAALEYLKSIRINTFSGVSKHNSTSKFLSVSDYFKRPPSLRMYDSTIAASTQQYKVDYPYTPKGDRPYDKVVNLIAHQDSVIRELRDEYFEVAGRDPTRAENFESEMGDEPNVYAAEKTVIATPKDEDAFDPKTRKTISAPSTREFAILHSQGEFDMSEYKKGTYETPSKDADNKKPQTDIVNDFTDRDGKTDTAGLRTGARPNPLRDKLNRSNIKYKGAIYNSVSGYPNIAQESLDTIAAAIVKVAAELNVTVGTELDTFHMMHDGKITEEQYDDIDEAFENGAKAVSVTNDKGEAVIVVGKGVEANNALVIGHETGHALCHHLMANAMHEVQVKNMRKAFKRARKSERGKFAQYTDDDAGFEEYFSDQFAAWIKHRRKDAGGIFRTIRAKLTQYLTNLTNRLKNTKYGRELLSRFKLDAPSKIFFDSIVRKAERGNVSSKVGTITDVKHFSTEKVKKSKIAKAVSGVFKGAFDFGKAATTRLRSVHAQISEHSKELADMLYQGRTSNNEQTAYVQAESAALNRWRAGLDRIHNKYIRREKGRLIKDDINEAYKQLQDGRPTSAAAIEITEYLNAFYAYARDTLPHFNLKDGEFPLAWDIDKINNQPSEFVEWATKTLKDGNDAMDEETATLLQQAVLHTIAPNFNTSKGAAFLEIVRQDNPDLTQLMRESRWGYKDPSMSMEYLISTTVKRVEAERIFSGYTLIDAQGENTEKYAMEVLRHYGFASVAKAQEAGFVEIQKDGILKIYEPHKKLHDLFKTVKAEHGYHVEKRVRKLVAGVFGPINNDIPKAWHMTNQWMSAIQVVTLLSFSTIASFPEIAPLLQTEGFVNGLKAVKKAIGKDYRQRAADMGFAQKNIVSNIMLNNYGFDNMRGTPRRITEAFFKLNLQTAWTNMTRTVGAALGERAFADYLAKSKSSNPKHLAEAKEFFDTLKLEPATLERWMENGSPVWDNELTPGTQEYEDVRSVQTALHQYVDNIIVRPNAAQTPLFMADSRFRMLTILKPFFWAWGKVVVGGIAHTMHKRYQSARKNGNGAAMATVMASAPMLLAAMFMLPLAALSIETRDWMRYGDDISPSDRDTDIEYLQRLVSRTGVLGPLELASSFRQAEQYGDSGVAALLGPSVQHIETLMSDGVFSKKFWRRTTPIMGQFPKMWEGVPNDIREYIGYKTH